MYIVAIDDNDHFTRMPVNTEAECAAAYLVRPEDGPVYLDNGEYADYDWLSGKLVLVPSAYTYCDYEIWD